MTRYARWIWMLLALAAQTASAQTLRAYERAGDKAFARGDLPTAKAHYEAVVEGAPDRERARYRLAETCRLTYDWAAAAEHYRALIGSGADAAFPLAPYHLAGCLKCLGEYDGARRFFSDFLEKNREKNLPVELDRAQFEIQGADALLPALLVSDQGAYTLLRLTDTLVNTPYSDFGAHEVDGQLYHSSRRFEAGPAAKGRGGLLTRLLADGQPLEQPNAPGRHIANSCTGYYGRRLYFSRCEAQTATPGPCAVYLSVEGYGEWTDGDRLGAPVNLPKTSNTQPAVGYDSLERSERLYFVSDRPGSLGGTDIWYCALDLDGLPRGEARNAGPEVNTPGDEATPFFHGPSQTLYFASEGRYGLGGHDIFRAARTEGLFAPAENIGRPFNSPAHDLYFVINADDTSGYLASNRPLDTASARDICCLDIYRFAEKPRPRPVLSLLEPWPPVFAAIGVERRLAPLWPSDSIDLGALLPIRLYFANDEPDSNSWASTTLLRYRSAFEAYWTLRETYREGFVRSAEPSRQAEGRAAVEAFFDGEVRPNAEKLNAFLFALLTRLQKGERFTVDVRGFTSPRSTAPYNIALAQRRIASVRNEWLAWRNGALATYLSSGALRLRILPIGEARSPAGISDQLDDFPRSVFSPDASRERRVEIEAVTRDR
jgi:hypothetical protein